MTSFLKILEADMSLEDSISYRIINGKILEAHTEEYKSIIADWCHMEGYDYDKDLYQRDRAHKYAITVLRERLGLLSLL